MEKTSCHCYRFLPVPSLPADCPIPALIALAFSVDFSFQPHFFAAKKANMTIRKEY